MALKFAKRVDALLYRLDYEAPEAARASGVLLDSETWKLGGLLRGQQGTDDAMAAGAVSGAIVIFLGAGLERAASPPAERGLPLIWRAGPAGAPPGGPAFSEVVFAPIGLHERPWSPSHLRSMARTDGGFDLTWAPRSRLDGDRWEGESRLADQRRYRVDILKAGIVIRSFETGTEAAIYAGTDSGTDFPDGFEAAGVAVAQWGDGYGWGVEAFADLA